MFSFPSTKMATVVLFGAIVLHAQGNTNAQGEYVDQGYAAQPAAPSPQTYNNAEPAPAQPYNNQGYAAQPATPQQYNNVEPAPAQPYNNQGYAAQPATPPPQQYNNAGTAPAQPYNNQGYAAQPATPPPQQYNNAEPAPAQPYNNQGYAAQPMTPPPQQNNNAEPAPAQTYNNQAYVAQPAPPQQQSNVQTGEESPKQDKPSRVSQSLQSMNFVLPIEKETWKIGSSRLEWNSIGYQFSWTRYRVEESGYSSVFGMTFGFLSGDVEDQVDLEGLDLNMKFGWGMAPVANDLVVALHFILGFDLKMLEGDYSAESESMKNETLFTYTATYVDAMIGGDIVVAYSISDSFGVIVGVDVTTNVFGIGSFGIESNVDYIDDDSTKLTYLFSGINIMPHIGLYFTF